MGRIKTGETIEAVDVHDNINRYQVDSVGSDAYAITPSPIVEAYASGQHFTFKAGTANTGACTLNVNGLGAKAIKKDANADLETGDILAGQIVEVVYDSVLDAMVLLSRSKATNLASFSSGLSSKNTADASTTQTIAHGLGKIPKRVKFTVLAKTPSVTNIQYHIGVFDASGNNSVGTLHGTSSGTFVSYISNVYAIALCGGTVLPSTIGQTGVVTVDATNITITWTKNGTPAGTVDFMWEAEG